MDKERSNNWKPVNITEIRIWSEINYLFEKHI